MADDDTTTTDDDGDTPASGPLRDIRDALNREKARNAELAAAVEAGKQAQRELAFVRAGVPLDHPVAKLYVSSYTGELEAEAIRQGWEALGQTTPASTEEPKQSPEDEPGAKDRKDLQDARNRLSAEGAPPGTEPEVDPIEDALRLGREAGNRGSEAAMTAYAQRIVDAAVAGDPRVVHTGVIDDNVRRQWMEDARQRQIRNRDRARERR